MRDQNKRVFRAKTAGRELLTPCYYYSAMSDNCRWHKSLFFKNLSHFCEFRLKLGLWIKIPVKQATFSQSAFQPSAEVLASDGGAVRRDRGNELSLIVGL